MSDQENLEIVQEWIAAINDHDADRLAATLDEDFVWELGESSTKGRDLSKESWALWFIAFPDLHFETQQTITDGDYMVSRFVMTGPDRAAEAAVRLTNAIAPIGAAAVQNDYNGPRF